MKTLYTFLFAVSVLAGFSISAQAADLIVAPGGMGGTYATVGAAIAAANNNDRIIVYPQPNNAAYTEGNLTITKSLQLLCANEGGFYTLDGSIQVSPAAAGMNLTIIGLKLLTGGISSGIAAPTGARCKVNLLNDSIMSGSVNFNHDNYDMTLASNFIYGNTTLRFGRVLGNHCTGSVTVNSDASVNNVGDTIMIIGNRIYYYTATVAIGALNWNSTTQFMMVHNNFLRLDYPANGYNYGIYVSNARNVNTGYNTIFNNTVNKSIYTLAYGLVLTGGANSNFDVQNNLVVASIGSAAYSFGSGFYNVHYNYATSFSFGGVTNDGTNKAATNTTINTNDGTVTNALSNTINGGNPDSSFVDINLTQNDAGCWGGSYTHENFFPITANDWARVILVTAPRRVMVNGTIQVKATGFDK